MRIQWTAVESSQIKEIGYDPEIEVLGIRFNPSKKAREAGAAHIEYHYSGVGPLMFAEFQSATSKGKWFEQFIKPFPEQFPFVRVD